MEIGDFITLIVGVLGSVIGAIWGVKATQRQHRFETKFGMSAELQKLKFEAHMKAWGLMLETSDRTKLYVGKSQKARKDWTERFMKFWYSEQGYGLLIDKPARKAIFDVVDYITYTVERDGEQFNDAKFTELKRIAQKAIGQVIGHTKDSKTPFQLEWFRSE